LFGEEKENKERERERAHWGQTITLTWTRASPKKRVRDGASNDTMKTRIWLLRSVTCTIQRRRTPPKC